MAHEMSTRLEDAIAQLPRIDSIPFGRFMYGGDPYTEQEILNSLTGGNVLFALNRAREARDIAVSWRYFHVGACLLYLVQDPPVAQFFSGINIKPEEESVINIHAEQLALKRMRKFGGQVITLIAVVGELQADTQSGMLAETLHPCGLCRDKLSESGLIIANKTLVVSALPDLRTIEMYSFETLHRFHETGDKTGIYHVELPDLNLLKPFEANGNEPIVLEDDEETIAEERIWTELVELPLLRYRMTGSFFPHKKPGRRRIINHVRMSPISDTSMTVCHA